MISRDFIYLNVRGLMERYENPSPQWREIVRALASTQINVFKRNGLIKPDAEALKVPIEEAVLRFSDYTPLGQQVLKSGAVERWLAACDRKNELSAYRDETSLQKRIDKFIRNGVSN